MATLIGVFIAVILGILSLAVSMFQAWEYLGSSSQPNIKSIISRSRTSHTSFQTWPIPLR
ncbi:hypothetical protein B0H67DRAFT_594750 [Lasiosphaeris hirsuta]|uniref:Uncharacterized protein n=1 Tax=Lasiosphaeris hirsuta TaxID=260670 RepID=A0AA39ZXX6_9PEZI|nr:hypothetical protein B0H67DRAFT_594750 [Lasiosphaeris hirsuta]